jgi:hypothetical protein
VRRTTGDFLNEILTILSYDSIMSTARLVCGMRTTLGRRKSDYLARSGVSLAIAALAAGIAGCGCNQPPSQNLEIRTWYDLAAVRDSLAGHHTLMNDLDSATAGYDELASPTANGGYGWEPIGGNYQGGAGRFVGTLDGHGYEIRNMSINRPDEQDVGVFGAIGREGVVRNVGAVNVTVIGREYVGGLVGSNYEGIVRDAYSTGSVAGDNGVGGLVGLNGGTVANCYATGTVTGDREAGGLVGEDYRGTIANCYATGTVTGTENVGGLVGYYRGTVRDSFWDTETSGQGTSAGGTGKTTAQMKDTATFSEAAWNIVAVANPSTRNSAYTWNIVEGQTYPFLSWQP